MTTSFCWLLQETGGIYSVGMSDKHVEECVVDHAPPPPIRASGAGASLVSTCMLQRHHARMQRPTLYMLGAVHDVGQLRSIAFEVCCFATSFLLLMAPCIMQAWPALTWVNCACWLRSQNNSFAKKCQQSQQTPRMLHLYAHIIVNADLWLPQPAHVHQLNSSS